MSRDHWTPEFLDAMRLVGDPPADAVVAELFAGGANVVHAVNYLMRDLVENDDVPSGALPGHVRDYFAATPLPAWADPLRLHRGSELFHRYGPMVVMLLNLYSLPLTYAAKKGVQVLARTDRLHSNSKRRIVETAQMIIDVMAPGGLDPASRGAGLRSAQKVRLMHATVRHLLGQDPTWDADLGVPINQEDLAGTLGAFSVAIIDGLQRLGVDLGAAEIDAYMHTWCVVGHVMGVREELLPTDHAAGLRLVAQIGERHFAACPEGQMMTAALLDMMTTLVPGAAFDAVPGQLVRFFVGERVAQILALPDLPGPHGESPLVQALRALGHAGDVAGDRSGLVQALARRFSGSLLDGMMLVSRGGQRLPFNIPTELRQVWGANWR
ncbi:MAG TPA: oxygenase MpaB family protein [Nannocystis sp.]|jgi:hypothetical protein